MVAAAVGRLCTSSCMLWPGSDHFISAHSSLARSSHMAHLPTRTLGNVGVHVCRRKGRGDALCPVMDQTRRAQELSVRGGPASWGGEESLFGRGWI